MTDKGNGMKLVYLGAATLVIAVGALVYFVSRDDKTDPTRVARAPSDPQQPAGGRSGASPSRSRIEKRVAQPTKKEVPSDPALNHLVSRAQMPGIYYGDDRMMEQIPGPTPKNELQYVKKLQSDRMAAWAKLPAEQKARVLKSMEKKIGLKSKPIKTTEEGTFLPFSVRSVARCGIGDYDLLSMELKHSPRSILMATVEPLNVGDTIEVEPRLFTLEELDQGFEHVFRIPPVASATPLGLFVCKTSNTSDTTCRDKRVIEFNTLINRYMKPQPESVAITDKIYFFQFVLVEPDRLQALPSNQLSGTTYGSLSWYLRLASNDGQNPAQIRWVKQMNDLIGSEHVDTSVDGSAVALNLPRMDRSICASVAGRE